MSGLFGFSGFGGFADTVSIYTQSRAVLDRALAGLLDIVDNIASLFQAPITAAAIIYIALLGYAVLSGSIAMTPRDLAIRFAKVVAVIVLVNMLDDTSRTVLEGLWAVPEGIGNEFAQQIAPVLQFSSLGPFGSLPGIGTFSDIDGLAAINGALASTVSSRVTAAYSDGQNYGTLAWIISMVPMILTILGIYIAKFVAAILVVSAPVVFAFSLFMGPASDNKVLLTWFKALAMTFISVILVYIIGITCVTMATIFLAKTLALDVALQGVGAVTGTLGITGAELWKTAYGLPQIAPLGIIAIFSALLMSQATSLAGSILGVAGINTQQATSFLQIGALNAAR